MSDATRVFELKKKLESAQRAAATAQAALQLSQAKKEEIESRLYSEYEISSVEDAMTLLGVLVADYQEAQEEIETALRDLEGS